MAETRIVVVKGGGDWADASVDVLTLPVGVDMQEARAVWGDWYRDYCKQLALHQQRWVYMQSGPKNSVLRVENTGRPAAPEYIQFVDFLVQRYGAVRNPPDVEVFED